MASVIAIAKVNSKLVISKKVRLFNWKLTNCDVLIKKVIEIFVYFLSFRSIRWISKINEKLLKCIFLTETWQAMRHFKGKVTEWHLTNCTFNKKVRDFGVSFWNFGSVWSILERQHLLMKKWQKNVTVWLEK